jgi:hypothetical protein
MATKLLSATIELSLDEPAFQLSEVHLQSGLPGMGWRRYQIIYVVRADRLAEFRLDMGPAENFTAPQFRILGGVQNERTGYCEILHTVGELRDIADDLRDRPAPFLSEIEPPDLWGQWFAEKEEKWRWRKRSSTFGPKGKVERNF